MTTEIRLYSGEIALVDDDVYDRVAGYRWYFSNNHSRRPQVYRKAPEYGANGRALLHRDVLQAPEGAYVTFRSRNSLDCRRDNLVMRLEDDEKTAGEKQTPARRIGPVNPGRDVAREVRGAVEETRDFVATVFRGWETYHYDPYADSDDWELARHAALDIAERIHAQFASSHE